MKLIDDKLYINTWVAQQDFKYLTYGCSLKSADQPAHQPISPEFNSPWLAKEYASSPYCIKRTAIPTSA